MWELKETMWAVLLRQCLPDTYRMLIRCEHTLNIQEMARCHGSSLARLFLTDLAASPFYVDPNTLGPPLAPAGGDVC